MSLMSAGVFTRLPYVWVGKKYVTEINEQAVGMILSQLHYMFAYRESLVFIGGHDWVAIAKPELAKRTGTTESMVNKVLKQLSDQGILHRQGGVIGLKRVTFIRPVKFHGSDGDKGQWLVDVTGAVAERTESKEKAKFFATAPSPVATEGSSCATAWSPCATEVSYIESIDTLDIEEKKMATASAIAIADALSQKETHTGQDMQVKKNILSAEQIQKKFDAEKHPPVDTQVKLNATGFYEYWRKLVPKHHPEVAMVAEFTHAQKGQINKDIIKLWGEHTFPALSQVIIGWSDFTKFCKVHGEPWKDYGLSPDFATLHRNRQHALNYYLSLQLTAHDSPATAKKPHKIGSATIDTSKSGSYTGSHIQPSTQSSQASPTAEEDKDPPASFEDILAINAKSDAQMIQKPKAKK